MSSTELEKRFERHFIRAKEPPKECSILTESTLWGQHGAAIWKPVKVEAMPSFYPIYRWRDYYSYSLLALILKKGRLDLNAIPIRATRARGFEYWPGNDTLDIDIVRLGRAHPTAAKITTAADYAERLASALLTDTALVESAHPAHSNVILCGGKDSLNLLLLPWKNPTVALSAEPNFDLVRRFVEQNSLGIEVIRLEDAEDPVMQQEEALLACCRVDLSQWRWGVHLQRFAQERGPRLVFWKGQVADLYTTPKWKAFSASTGWVGAIPRRAYKVLSNRMPRALDRAIGRLRQSEVIRSTWTRVAALQGSHMEFLRELTGCLFVSGYHGPNVQRVWCEVDLASAAPYDMRHLVGRLLAGRDVVYPASNPGPSPSAFRVGLGKPDTFFALLDRLGFPYATTSRRAESP